MLKLQEENIDLIELLFRSMLSKGQCSQHKSNFDTFAKKKGKIFKVHLSHLQGIKTNYWQLTDLWVITRYHGDRIMIFFYQVCLLFTKFLVISPLWVGWLLPPCVGGWESCESRLRRRRRRRSSSSAVSTHKTHSASPPLFGCGLRLNSHPADIDQQPFAFSYRVSVLISGVSFFLSQWIVSTRSVLFVSIGNSSFFILLGFGEVENPGDMSGSGQTAVPRSVQIQAEKALHNPSSPPAQSLYINQRCQCHRNQTFSPRTFKWWTCSIEFD